MNIITLHGMLYLLALKGIKEICPVSYIFCWFGIKFSTGCISKTLLSDSKVFENWPN
jgi:Na+-translocating ferredoxin:NAD+ oxidoreductase RnfD subunit